jgi:hypothetical protein
LTSAHQNDPKRTNHIKFYQKKISNFLGTQVEPRSQTFPKSKRKIDKYKNVIKKKLRRFEMTSFKKKKFSLIFFSILSFNIEFVEN